MEFKVWVEGIQRVICGVTPSTTSQDVIVALAQATGKTGRFTLVEQWRDNERLLAPSDNPLRVLHKYGEYASDVHFILRQSETDAGQKSRFTHNFTPPPSGGIVKRNLTFSGAHNSPADFLPGYRQKRSKTPLSNAITEESDSVGNETRPAKPKQPPPYYMVERMLHDNLQRGRVIQENGHSSHKGVAHDRGSPHGGKAGQDGEWRSTQGHVETHEFIISQPQATRRSTTPEVEGSGRQSRENVNGPVNYNSLERKKRHGDSPQVPVCKPRCPTDYHHDKRMPISMGADAHDISVTPESKYSNRTSPPKEPAAWSRRSPDGRSPPGSRSPVKSRRELREKETDAEEFDLELSLFREDGSGSDHIQHFQDKVMASKVSRDQLLKLITLQRQKLETQQAQMTNTDTDLTVLENREKDYDDKLDDVISQIRHLEVEDRQLSQEIAENESVRWADDITVQQQTEKTLQAELTLIRSRLANCESELLQCRNQTCRLTEELDQEAREQEVAAREEEAKIVEKVEHLKKKVELAETQAETDAKVLAQVDNEITQQECQLEHKNQEASQLEGAIKQANLQTFSKVKPEKQDKDEKTTRTSTSPGSSKIGSVRKMTGSPQLLGETVPTTRNPQGLWV